MSVLDVSNAVCLFDTRREFDLASPFESMDTRVSEVLLDGVQGRGLPCRSALVIGEREIARGIVFRGHEFQLSHDFGTGFFVDRKKLLLADIGSQHRGSAHLRPLKAAFLALRGELFGLDIIPGDQARDNERKDGTHHSHQFDQSAHARGNHEADAGGDEW